ncbi:hypothetical protein LCGC14_0295430 [marine sediment metagenome]|uniref:Uncharacterized protein n=1 Tax=marine sediment metagenome TaxID=412755 RepID=A0A0F9TS84_9ZZZZ
MEETELGAATTFIGEYQGAREPDLSGDHHLHFLIVKRRWVWILRMQPSTLCKTPRCRRVRIHELCN